MPHKLKDLLERAAWTFVQAFAATVLVHVNTVTSLSTAKVLAIAGIAAGISALKTWVKETL